MKRGDAVEARHVVVPSALVVGDSCAPFRG
jgi:hypothetical protein